MKKLSKKEMVLVGVSVGFGISLVALGINQKKIIDRLDYLKKEVFENGASISEIVDFINCLDHTVNDMDKAIIELAMAKNHNHGMKGDM